MASVACYQEQDPDQEDMCICADYQREETLSTSISSLSRNILYDVLRRVDAVTLAKVSCLNREFRCASEDEFLWKDLCNERWPSTRDPHVKSILSSVGGYRKFYSECYPCIASDEHFAKSYEEATSSHDGTEQFSHFSPSDFTSIVDVVYEESSVFTKVVEGMAGNADPYGHLSTCAFRVDLINRWAKEYYGVGEHLATSATGRYHSNNIGSLKIIEGSRLPKTAFKKLRLSWILINRRTGQMVNLASWKPLSVQHWLGDGEFLLKYGSVLPAIATTPAGLSKGCRVVQCNISLLCSLERGRGATEGTLKLNLTELGLYFEDSAGSLLSGKDSLKILQQALMCPKTTRHEEALDSYHRYVEA